MKDWTKPAAIILTIIGLLTGAVMGWQNTMKRIDYTELIVWLKHKDDPAVEHLLGGWHVDEQDRIWKKLDDDTMFAVNDPQQIQLGYWDYVGEPRDCEYALQLHKKTMLAAASMIEDIKDSDAQEAVRILRLMALK